MSYYEETYLLNIYQTTTELPFVTATAVINNSRQLNVKVLQILRFVILYVFHNILSKYKK